MSIVGGRFEILSLAGRGGMGRVFRSRDTQTGAIVALKLLSLQGEETTMRFRRETDALARLEHPGIVRYVAGGTDEDGAPFLAMEWIEGEDLRARLKREGRLEVSDVVALGKRLAAALAHAHARGIVHRDVKPSNVVLPTKDLADAVLIDFGLARTGNDELTQTGMLVGTPIYMAPEQVRDNAVAPSIDVFALACVMYQCLTQTTPFAANGATAVLARVLFDEPVAVERLVPELPAPLGALIGTMLRKSPAERPSMPDVLRALDELDGAPPSTTVAVPAHLSAAEQRVVSVIIAGAPAKRDESDTMRQMASPSVDAARAFAIAARFGAESSPLPNGAIIALLSARGAATAATDLAARAAECALEIARALPKTPVALATGRAQTGEGVPIGEAIDRAVALAPYEGDGVRVDDVTAGLLGSRSEIRQEKEGLVLRRASGRGDPAPTFLGMPAACVGRDAELATLEGAIAQSASESVARVVLVTGPAGVGKSRIRHELVARCAASGDTAIWIGRGDAVAAGVPFGVLGPMVRREAGIAPGESVEASRAKLVARVAKTVEAPDAERVATFVGEMIGVRFDDGVQLRAARADPQLMGDQMRRAFVDWLEAECRAKPVALVLDDLQWGDRPTIDAIDAALRVLEERPLAVVAFARQEIADIFPDAWRARGVQSVPLAPLPKRAATRLARAVLDESAPDAIVETLVEKAAGNVFFLEELLRAEVEGRGGEVPPTVVAMVQSRLGALEPDARRVLRAASVLGDAFVADAVRELLGEQSLEVERWLETLVRREVLQARARRGSDEPVVEYVFRHALVREGAYAMLTDADRALGHKLAAGWLERHRAAPLLVVAGHYERAGENARAAVAYLGAAEQSLESSDLRGALAQARRGLALGAPGDFVGALRLVEAQACHWLGDTEEMETAATQAVAKLGREDPRWADAMTLLAVAKQRLGRTTELAAVSDDLLTMLRTSGDDRALARAGGRVASLLFFAGKQDRAATMLDAAERAARGGGADVEARIHQARAPHARQAGRPEAALRHAEAAEAAFRVAGDLRNACLMSGIRGFALSELGAYHDAERALRAALATAERLGLATVAATARSNLGMVCLRLGRAREAENELRAAIAEFESSDRRHEGGSRAYLALVLRDAGALEAAEEQARRSLVLLEAALALRPLAGGVLASVLLAAGRADEALAAARDAMRWPESGGNVEEGDALVRLVHARALFATGADEEARRALAVARDRLLARAHTIEDAGLRECFMKNVPEHATTFELAATWRV